MADAVHHRRGAVVEVSEREIELAYNADFGRGQPLKDVAASIRQRLADEKREVVWARWLAAKRGCANVVVHDESWGLLSSSPNPGCQVTPG